MGPTSQAPILRSDLSPPVVHSRCLLLGTEYLLVMSLSFPGSQSTDYPPSSFSSAQAPDNWSNPDIVIVRLHDVRLLVYSVSPVHSPNINPSLPHVPTCLVYSVYLVHSPTMTPSLPHIPTCSHL